MLDKDETWDNGLPQVSLSGFTVRMFLEENQTIPYAALRYTCLALCVECCRRPLKMLLAASCQVMSDPPVYSPHPSMHTRQNQTFVVLADFYIIFSHWCGICLPRASEANYGGRVTDAHDRITITNLVTDYYCEDILKERLEGGFNLPKFSLYIALPTRCFACCAA